MKLKELEIFDFKSIKYEKIDLKSNQICLVGINESGKSSILEAASYLNVLDKEMSSKLINKGSKRYPDGFPMVCGLFEMSITEVIKFKSWIEKEYNDYIKFPDSSIFYIYLKRLGNGLNNIKIILADLKDYSTDLTEIFKNETSKFLDYFLHDYLPFIEIYTREDLLIEPASVEELEGDEVKFETFRRLLYIGGCKNYDIFSSEDINRISTYLHSIDLKLKDVFAQHYKQDESIYVSINGYGPKLTVVIRDSTNHAYSINERSPGFQYYFAFLINKLYLNFIHDDRSVIYLLDEPGNNLHPKGAKDLLKTFNEVASKNQIIYTTHNPFLAIRNDLDSLLFVRKDSKDGTKINRKPFLNKYQLLRKELGILLNDSFLLGDINLVVEGNTEKLALHRLFQEEQFKELEWLNIYNADGVGNVSQALNYLGKKNLNLSGIALIDSDTEGRAEMQKKFFSDTMKDPNWSSLEINQAFSNKSDRTFEDLFPQNIYVDSFNEYCLSLKELEIFDSEYTPYVLDKPIPTPIVDTLSKHFFSFIDPDKRKNKSITKQDVIRIVLEKIDNLDTKNRSEALSNVHKILGLLKDSLSKIKRHAHT